MVRQRTTQARMPVLHAWLDFEQFTNLFTAGRLARLAMSADGARFAGIDHKEGPRTRNPGYR